MKDSERLVYSTESGRICPECQQPKVKCACRNVEPIDLSKGIRITRESKGRKGKTVTLISGLPLEQEELKKLGKLLKTKCGCGGTVKNGIIEIQGDVRNVVLSELKERGFSAKLAGG